MYLLISMERCSTLRNMRGGVAADRDQTNRPQPQSYMGQCVNNPRTMVVASQLSFPTVELVISPRDPKVSATSGAVLPVTVD